MKQRRRPSTSLLLAGTLLTIGSAGAAVQTAPAPVPATQQLRQEAKSLEPMFRATLVQRFLAATADLPSISPRNAMRDPATRRYYTPAEAETLPEQTRKGLEKVDLDEEYYYNTRYGTPLAYSRPLEILAEAGFDTVEGKKLLDFGYGGIGHLRLLASLGAEVVGVEVDPLLKILYGQPGDQGTIKGRHGKDGTLTLVDGQFPADDAVNRAVGDGYDLVISKNVLKNGYIHPAEPVDPRRLVHLGVDEETFVRRLFTILKPGGRALIYNLCPAPAPAGKPYIPWADGRSPFSETLFKTSGFTVVAFDKDDTSAARLMGRALGWHEGESAMDLEKDLFATYTLVEKPR